MNSPLPNPEDSIESTPEEERIGALLNEYFDRLERGESLTQETFLSENPDHADALREHFAGLDLIGGLGSSAPVIDKTQSRYKGSSAKPAGQRVPTTPMPDIHGYELLKHVGRGGMGMVFKAIQISTKRVVALKVLLEGPYALETSRRRFEREIALAAQLKHPNIIPIYDSGTADDRMYYAMEFVYGQGLCDYVRINNLSRKARLLLFVKTCKAISHAHQRGVVHRDLKPSNILVDGEGEPHILDFGLAKAAALDDNNTSITAQILGTPAYMSPEQATGDPGGIDIRTDVYSLGMMLYELLTGRMPYDTTGALGKVLHHIAHSEPPPANTLDTTIDDDLSAIAAKALEKSKDSRYQSVDALCTDIQRYLDGQPITVRPASIVTLLRKSILKNRTRSGVLAALLLFAVTTFVLVRYFSGVSKQKDEKLDTVVQKLQNVEAEMARARDDKLALERQRLELEQTRRAYELNYRLLTEKLDPNVAALLRQASESLGKGEDSATTIARLLTSGLVGMANPATQPAVESRPSGESQFQPAKLPEISPETIEILKLLAGLRQVPSTQPAANASPASQPADLHPAANNFSGPASQPVAP